MAPKWRKKTEKRKISNQDAKEEDNVSRSEDEELCTSSANELGCKAVAEMPRDSSKNVAAKLHKNMNQHISNWGSFGPVPKRNHVLSVLCVLKYFEMI